MMTSKENKQNNFWELESRHWFVYCMAIVQAYHMGRAFDVYDPNGWSFYNVNIFGFILGLIVNLTIAKSAIKLPSIAASFESLKQLLPKIGKQADKKALREHSKALKEMTLAGMQNKYSQRGFYVLVALSVAIIAPALFIVWSESLHFNPYFICLLAVIGAGLPDFAMTVGGFISSDAGSDGQRRSATKPATVSVAGSVGQRRSKPKSATVSVAVAKIYQCVCDYETKNRYEFSGHTRTCTKYQEKKRTALDTSLLIDPSKVVVKK
jgi:hypothetical protein